MSVLNKLINKLPFEAHIPGYQYCGPGTKLEKRLARGDPGRNELDRACKDHDIAYSQSSDLKERHIADSQLADKAWQRVKAKDSSFGEKIAAWGVTNAMKAKVKMGLGLKKPKQKKTPFKSAIKDAVQAIRLVKPPTVGDSIAVARNSLKKLKKKNVKVPRVIPIKTGGILPLIPILAGLSALGSLAGGAAGIASAVNKARSAQQQLGEMKRHNQTMEAVAIGKGLYLGPYKKGAGLFLKPYPKN